MKEGTEPVETKEKSRRSRRPPRPLTHHMDAEALQHAYYKAGLLRPELTKVKKRSDKKNAPRRRASNRNKETLKMNDSNQDTQQHAGQQTRQKPGVGGTQQAQQDDSFNMKCAKAGGTAVLVGLTLKLVDAGVRRWLG